MAAAAAANVIAINNVIAIKLSSSKNYCAWRMQFQTVLRGYDLIGYVDGSHPKPTQTAAAADAYSYWIRQDQLLLNAIVCSLSPELVPLIVTASTSKQAWDILAAYAKRPSTWDICIMQLRSALDHLSKGTLFGGGSTSGSRRSVRIAVIGDRGTGKSSLIAAVAGLQEVPPVLPPTHLPSDFYPDNVPIILIDTSSSLGKVGHEELKRADAVVLTYACNQPRTLNRLSSFWLHELRRLEIKAPVIVAGCKRHRRDAECNVSVERKLLMEQFGEIENCIEYWAANTLQTKQVFLLAQNAVLHPASPLYDEEAQALKPRYVRALKRIFILCDLDMDGALNDEELNEFQVKNVPLQHAAEIVNAKNVVGERFPKGVNEVGLTLAGFIFLHSLFIERGRTDIAWTVLRKFGYNEDLKLRDDYLSTPRKKAPDEGVELTSEALEFLKGIFTTFDHDKDGVLQESELERLFSTAPQNPWDNPPYKDAVDTTPMSLSGFLSQWALMTLLDPAQSIANLIYVGHNRNTSTMLNITRGRLLDKKKQRTERNVFQCFIFGPKKAGKSALLTSFLGRPFSENYTPTTSERYVVNIVHQYAGSKKSLILREIPEDGVEKLLSNKECLGGCDVAVFVYDSSSKSSLNGAIELLCRVARHGEESGFGMPCLLIAAKNDVNSIPISNQDRAAKIFVGMGMEAPIPVSAKAREMNDVFWRIVNAAQHPHLNVPQTHHGRIQKRCHRLDLAFHVGAAAIIVTHFWVGWQHTTSTM